MTFIDIYNTDKKYNIIYADPPWSYKDKALSGNRGACCKYEVHDSEWIAALPIKNIVADDCVLFMWVTMPQLNVAFDIISAWGFNYKTVAFTWIKTNKKSDTLFWGMGRWTRANAEICLLATKGHPKRVSAGVHSVIMSKIRQHSQKPYETYDRIETLMGDIPRIELFARQEVEGWDCWGNEVSA
jgi:N6-adenosine-specific RNA methylase IME4